MDYCELSPNSVEVKWDSSLERFTQISDPPSRTRTRTLESTTNRKLRSRHELSTTPTRTSGSDFENDHIIRLLDDSEKTNQNTYQAKQCPCVPNSDKEPVFCLTRNKENLCRIATGDDGSTRLVGCFRNSSADIFIRNALPVAILWLAAMFIYMIATEGGRSGLRYAMTMLGGCLPFGFRDNDNDNARRDRSDSPNQQLINDILRREADARRRFQRMVSNRMIQQSSHANPVTYILKTTEFKKKEDKDKNSVDVDVDAGSPGDQTLPLTPQSTKSSSSSLCEEDVEDIDLTLTCAPCLDVSTTSTPHRPIDDDENEVTCAICIVEIEDGDRIGVLPCEHQFHVECLKQWIKRRNVCPLCQVPDIARAKEESDHHDHANENENENEHEHGGRGPGPGRQFVTRGITGINGDGNEGAGTSPRIAWGRNFSRRDMQNIQRDLFHVNGGGGRGGRFGRTDAGAGAGSSARRGRVILVGETRTIRVARTAGRNSNDERFAAARSRINAWNT